MSRHYRGLVVLVTVGLLLVPGVQGSSASVRPNVMIILADDMGYSDLGCYGGEIETPCVDSLAKSGLRFSQFYNTGRCWPTRAALMTGFYAQQVGRDKLPNGPAKRGRPAWARLLPEMLHPEGYRCYHSGKWHIDGTPLQGGFDRSYWTTDHNRFFTPKSHLLDDRKLPAVQADEDYYVTTAIADRAIEFLESHQNQYPDQPFFSFVAFISPHFPLHARPTDIDRFRERYKAGWDAVRRNRWQRIRQMQRLPGDLSALEPAVGPPYSFPDAIRKLGPGEVNRERDWNSLSAEQQEFQSSKMAIHAAMIYRMDLEIGRIIEQLRRMNRLDDTLILVLSDNGASAEIMIRGDGHDPNAPRGSAQSYLCLGPGWSSAANTPFRRHKTWVHEGGIATPLVVHWPSGISDSGHWRDTPGHVIDIVPTVLEACKVEGSNSGDGPDIAGKSLLPAFHEEATIERDAIWWYHEGNRALRLENWKLVAAKNEEWQLYDLKIDRAENNNLADEFPERVAEMKVQWEAMTEAFRQDVAR